MGSSNSAFQMLLFSIDKKMLIKASQILDNFSPGYHACAEDPGNPGEFAHMRVNFS